MSKRTVGSRVFAVVDADASGVRLLGFGTYVGDEVPPRPLGMGALFGATWEAHDAALAVEGYPDPVRPKNPKIVLDDGETVWGAECWWGPEETYAKFRGDRPETRVSIVEARKGRGG
jgi:hypothetical protein